MSPIAIRLKKFVADNTSPSAMKFVPKYYKTQETCDKAADTRPFVFNSVPDWYKTQEICDTVVSKDAFYVKILPWCI